MSTHVSVFQREFFGGEVVRFDEVELSNAMARTMWSKVISGGLYGIRLTDATVLT